MHSVCAGVDEEVYIVGAIVSIILAAPLGDWILSDAGVRPILLFLELFLVIVLLNVLSHCRRHTYHTECHISFFRSLGTSCYITDAPIACVPNTLSRPNDCCVLWTCVAECSRNQKEELHCFIQMLLPHYFKHFPFHGQMSLNFFVFITAPIPCLYF